MSGNSSTKTSLIIPTLNRPEDLTRCLESITKLTQGFDEIIVVEQGNMANTEAVIGQFDNLAIDLYYHPIKSAAQARNLAIEKARGDFVFIIDDDTELAKNYVKVALSYFANHPNVVGITGITGEDNYSIRGFVTKLIAQLLYFSSLKGVILKSGVNGVCFFMYKEQTTQYLTTCHLAYRKAVFDAGFRFNQDFIRWSFNEDVMLSYQIYKHYGRGSLMHVPDFMLTHHASDEARITSASVLRMSIIYRFIFWHKEVYQKRLLNLVAYLYGQLYFVQRLLRKTDDKGQGIKEIIATYRYILRNHQSIVTNKVDYNAYILENQQIEIRR